MADARDHVSIIHRGETVKAAGGAPAPPRRRIRRRGQYRPDVGRPGAGYEWPQQVHGITVDASDRVWITGNGETDAHMVAFPETGKFIRQIGRSGPSSGSDDGEPRATRRA